MPCWRGHQDLINRRYGPWIDGRPYFHNIPRVTVVHSVFHKGVPSAKDDVPLRYMPSSTCGGRRREACIVLLCICVITVHRISSDALRGSKVSGQSTVVA